MAYNFKHIVLAAAVIASAMLCGCDKEAESLQPASKDRTFKVDVSMGDVQLLQTKSADSQAFTLSNEDGSMSLGMTCEQTAMESGVATKAVGTGIMNLDELKEQGFNMKVWSPTAEVFDGTVAWVDNAWKIGDGTAITWPENTAYTVFAYANNDNLSPSFIDGNDKGIRFTSWSLDINNTDVIVAKYSGNGTNGVAPLTFIHPLASVCFKVDESCTDLSVSEIKIDGVIASGNFVFRSASSGWDHTGRGNITKSFESPVTSGELLKCYFAPQTFGTGDEKITVKITTSDSQTLTCDLTSGGWSEGNSYTYKISKGTTPTPPTTDKIIVTVSDDVNVTTGVKNNVVISNSSESTQKCYIRATITGGWFDDETNKLVQDWYVDTSNTAGFNGLTCNTTGSKGNWIFSVSDGFWYFNAPVEKGSSTSKPLFNSFTLPTTITHPSGSHFEMKIIVQGVIWDADKTNVTTAWGTGAASQLFAE